MAKRILDLVLSLTAFVIFMPFGLIIALILLLTGEHEVFYLQERVGYQGRRFKLFKFATMLKDSPNLGTGDITVRNDPRVLPFGRFLRKTKLNEVPQLINIIRGEMSVVGPRPVTPGNFNMYSPEVQATIARVKPGLTGMGSIAFRDEEAIIHASGKDHLACYQEDIVPYKGALEQWYAANQGLVTDLKIIFLTAWVILFPSSQLFEKCFKGLPAIPPQCRL